MSGYALPIKRLIKELSRLPGIGGKTAARLAAYIIRASEEDARSLAESILDVKRKIRLCSICFNLAEGEICDVCADAGRNRELLCVVEEPDSLIALEESGGYRGVYHVLHGALSPLDGIGPEHLRIGELLDRIACAPHGGGDRGHEPERRGGDDGPFALEAPQGTRRQRYAHRPRRPRGRRSQVYGSDDPGEVSRIPPRGVEGLA